MAEPLGDGKLYWQSIKPLAIDYVPNLARIKEAEHTSPSTLI